jgi:hypothetical protein
MPPPRPIHPKERKVYELSNDEKFSLGRSAKIGIIFNLSCILFLGCKLTFAMASIGTFHF